MKLYAWVTPAFIPSGYVPVDHSWVTTYDMRDIQRHSYSDIDDVRNANQSYWFCHGGFHQQSNPVHPIASRDFLGNANCLVRPNDSLAWGTIFWYGIDGVCHQVSNQVLYVTATAAGGKALTVELARGYTFSSVVFDTYGRRKEEWEFGLKQCGFVTPQYRLGRVSLLVRRMAALLGCKFTDPRIRRLELLRRQMLANLDQIGFAPRAPNETVRSRVARMNDLLNQFILDTSRAIEWGNDSDFIRVFGVPRNDHISLIDPELFKFPDGPPPQRGSHESPFDL